MFYDYLYLCRIAEKERQWEMKMKEALAQKEQRITAVHQERDKKIAEVSMQLKRATINTFFMTE